MNRALFILSAFLAVLFAAVAGFFIGRPDPGSQLAALEKVATLEKELQSARSEIAALKVKAASAVPSTPVETVSAKKAADASKPAVVAETSTKETPKPSPVTAAAAKGSPGNMLREMMKSPGMKEAMKQQQTAQLDMTYGKLYDKLHLNDAEKAKFKELLAGRVTAMADFGIKMMDDTLTPEAKTELSTQAGNLEKEFDASIRAFLADEGDYKTYQHYDETQGDRMSLNMLGSSLFAASGEPLSPQQEEQLIDVMADVRKTTSKVPDMRKPENFNPDAMTDDTTQRILADNEAQGKLTSERAAAFLSPTQLKALKQFQDQQRSMTEMGLKMSAAMFGKKDKP